MTIAAPVERLISADSHVNPPPDLWCRDAPAHLKDRVPRVESTPEGDVWVVDGRSSIIPGLSFMAGRQHEDYRIRIAYKEMRAIEAEINRRRGEDGLRSEIPLTNFRGIELRDFPAEIARLVKELEEAEAHAARLRGQLANEQFRSRAPADVVEGFTNTLREAEHRIEGLRARVEGLRG